MTAVFPHLDATFTTMHTWPLYLKTTIFCVREIRFRTVVYKTVPLLSQVHEIAVNVLGPEVVDARRLLGVGDLQGKKRFEA